MAGVLEFFVWGTMAPSCFWLFGDGLFCWFFSFGIFQCLGYLFVQLAEIGELTVDTGKTDVGDFIEVTEVGHGLLTDGAGRNLGVASGVDILLNLIYQSFDPRFRNRSFFTSPPNP